MKKEEFYIYQEELIRYKFSHDKLSISKMVVELNKQFCSAGMKKLRIETITNYLVKQGFLFLNEEGYKRPAIEGKVLGISVEKIVKENKEYMVNQYNRRAQSYVLDMLYDMIREN